MRFARYGATFINGISLLEMLAIQRDGWRQGVYLFANAEYSGCEGCYCEVAIWKEDNDQQRGVWKKFAFEKFFGGELAEIPDANDWETACWYARQINDAASAGCPSLVHDMKSYEGADPVIETVLST